MVALQILRLGQLRAGSGISSSRRILSSSEAVIRSVSACRNFSTCSVLRAASQLSTGEGSPSTSKKKWSGTLLLPKTDFPMRHKDPVHAEMEWRDRTTSELYKWQWENNKGPFFILHDGPPYANGNIHMGHAMNKVLKDFINRYKALRGFRVKYIPGWDCHGLPIENKALQELGRSHLELTPQAVRSVARKTALQAIDVQKKEFKQLGIMADWEAPDGTYRTLDNGFEIRQLKVLKKMLERGLLVHRKRPTYYSPSSRTALAEAELKYDDNHKSRSVYVYFKVPEDAMSPALRELWMQSQEGQKLSELGLAIWTTTAWTLPANMAVLAGPDMDYCMAVLPNSTRAVLVAESRAEALSQQFGPLQVVGKLSGVDLVGTEYEHLFWGEGSPRPSVIPSDHVTTDTGTGLVHSAPGHGQEDYEAYRLAFKDSSDDFRCPVDDAGNLTEIIGEWADGDVASRIIGKNVLGDAVPEIISVLSEKGILLAEEEIEHRYPCDWKTKEPVIIRATPQWFADLDDIKDAAIKALENVDFKPEQCQCPTLCTKELICQAERAWGVPIPALQDVDTGEVILTIETLDHIIPVLASKGVDYWWSDDIQPFVPKFLQGRNLRKTFDTMDVWFDSGSSWTLIKEMALRLQEERTIADVYLEGSDQHRGWFQSSLLTSLCSGEPDLPGISPYRGLITHGFVLDHEGKKMSKSIGNIISPTDVINGDQSTPAYGADVLRLWAASVEYTKDVNLGAESLRHSAENMRRIRNAVKYLLGTVYRKGSLHDPPGVEEVDRYVLHEISTVEADAVREYENYNFSKVLQSINVFNTNVLSSVYFESVKDILYCDAEISERRQAVVAVLNYVLKRLVRVISPLMPHLAEEISQHSRGISGSDGLTAMAMLWEDQSERWIDRDLAEKMQILLGLRQTTMQLVESARRNGQLKVASEAVLTLESPTAKLVNLLEDNHAALSAFFTTSSVVINRRTEDGAVWTHSAAYDDGSVIANLTLASTSLHKCPRCWNHTAESAEILCRRCADVVTPPSTIKNVISDAGQPKQATESEKRSQVVLGSDYPIDEATNVPPSIIAKLPRRLHLQANHPVSILRNLIESHFSDPIYTQPFNALSPDSAIVTTEENFDELGFPPDHPGRSLTDSYYLNKTHMLRTHTSAHEVATFKAGYDKWLLSADVYRRDEIDASHYPVFHQMEGARVWTYEPSAKDDFLRQLREENARLGAELEKCPIIIEDDTKIGESNPVQPCHDEDVAREVAQSLKHHLNGMIYHLFGKHARQCGDGPLRVRWIEAYFPFTTPSYEVEVWWGGEWLEILGSGVIMQKTLETAGVPQKLGWAFGLGLERIAMILFSIPDIRLFWTEDKRFLDQFQEGAITTFKSYSKFPPCYKDVSFWTTRQPSVSSDTAPNAGLTEEQAGAKAAGGGMPQRTVKAFHENDFCEIVREVAGDLAEDVKLIDDFTNKKTGRTSKCYRINYRHMDRSLSNEEVNELQTKVVDRLAKELDIELR